MWSVWSLLGWSLLSSPGLYWVFIVHLSSFTLITDRTCSGTILKPDYHMQVYWMTRSFWGQSPKETKTNILTPRPIYTHMQTRRHTHRHAHTLSHACTRRHTHKWWMPIYFFSDHIVHCPVEESRDPEPNPAGIAWQDHTLNRPLLHHREHMQANTNTQHAVQEVVDYQGKAMPREHANFSHVILEQIFHSPISTKMRQIDFLTCYKSKCITSKGWYYNYWLIS